MADAIHMEGLDFAYNGTLVLQNVRMTLEEGHVACLIGPNGGGKTTLLRVILGLLHPVRGTVRVLGRPPVEARLEVGYVPQDFVYDARFPIRVRDVVAMGSINLRLSRSQRRQRTRHALDSVGLRNLGNAWFSGLSGGQRQRVLIARALTTAPRLLVLDEPTSSVDAAAEQDILEVLEQFRGNTTMLMVSHSAEVAAHFLEDIYCVNREVHRHPPTDRLDTELMRHLVGVDFTGAAPPDAS